MEHTDNEYQAEVARLYRVIEHWQAVAKGHQERHDYYHNLVLEMGHLLGEEDITPDQCAQLPAILKSALRRRNPHTFHYARRRHHGTSTGEFFGAALIGALAAIVCSSSPK